MSTSRSAPPCDATPPSTGVRIGEISPYSGRGPVADFQLDASGFADNPSDEYVWSLRSQPVVAVVRADEQRVGDQRYSRIGLEPRLEDHRSIHIAARHAE